MRERAEPPSSAHAGAALEPNLPEHARPGLLWAAEELCWLTPGAAALAALGRPPTHAVWSGLRHDPGAVLLLLRLLPPGQPGRAEAGLPTYLSLLHEPALYDLALRCLATPSGFVDWGDAALHPIYRTAVRCARTAERLALRLGGCDPDDAWVCGLLAPLGWFAVGAVAPAKAAACLTDPGLVHDAPETQLRHWGIDQAALARRLARRWRLPGWVAAVAGYLRLPVAQAQTFGADKILFHLARLAIGLVREQGNDLGLGAADWAPDAAAALGLSLAACAPLARCDDEPVPAGWEAPHARPLLRELLELAAENRRLRDLPLQARLERELDGLQNAFEEQVRGEERRLQSAKLSALAEFAAGAGHEINNPLAVISGQAQHLLGHARDWIAGDGDGRAAQALHTIIAQTRRVHGILRDLMQFARPVPPSKTRFDLPALLGEVAAALEEAAAQRGVRVEVGRTPEKLPLFADAGQVRVGLSCLLRNAIEAAPAQGWARLRILEPLGEHRVEVAIEDNGAGPEEGQRDHLFDPFFSGRAAGRGRGLGLPIAWRLLRQQGGEVRLATTCTQGPTRFLVTLPRPADDAGVEPGHPSCAAEALGAAVNGHASR